MVTSFASFCSPESEIISVNSAVNYVLNDDQANGEVNEVISNQNNIDSNETVYSEESVPEDDNRSKRKRAERGTYAKKHD